MAKRKRLSIKRAVKHPGALTEAAEKRGVSKRQEAEKESHSSDPSVRGRGQLGLRFMKGGDLHSRRGRKSRRRSRRR